MEEQDIEQLILEQNQLMSHNITDSSRCATLNRHSSEYQLQFVQYLNRRNINDEQHIGEELYTVARHRDTIRNGTNAALCQHRIDQYGIPFLVHGTHTSKMMRVKSTKLDDDRFDHIIDKHKFSPEKHALPTYMTAEEFAFCTTHVKLQLNSKAVTTLNIESDIPQEVLQILSYGPKFALPLPMSKENSAILMNAISALNIYNFAVYECNTLIAMAKYHIKNLADIKGRTTNAMQRFLVHCHNCMLKFFHDNNQLMMAQADKGSISIVMKKEHYIDKMNDLLMDHTVYDPINTSSHTGYSIRNEQLLKELSTHGAIKPEHIPEIITNEQRIANIYGLVKLHKEAKPLRPVVNTRQTPGYRIAKVITSILSTARDTHKYNIRNSMDFIHRMERVQLEPTDFLVTVDISNMFTNIDTEAAIKAVIKRYNENKIITNIPLATIIKCIRFVIQHATEIEFNGKLYKQRRGLRMGGSLSTILADFVIEDLFDLTFRNIPRPKLITKYIDDCLMAACRRILCTIIDRLNEFDENLKFIPTHENENAKIIYLNLELHNKHNLESIYTSWYTKPFSSGRLIHYHSSHPRSTIFNTMKAYITQMFALTHRSGHNSITCKAREILAANGFPANIAANIIDKLRQKIDDPIAQKDVTVLTVMTELQDPHDRHIDSPNLNNERIYIPLPHFEHISGIIQKEVKLMKPNIKTMGTPVHTLTQLNNQHKNLRNGENESKRYITLE